MSVKVSVIDGKISNQTTMGKRLERFGEVRIIDETAVTSQSILRKFKFFIFCIFLGSYVEEKPWRPIKSPDNGRKKNERLRGEGDQIKFINLRFDGRQVV